MHIITGIVSAIVILMILVVVHECGHFFTAKAVGVKVNEFSIGMGPLLFQRSKGDTDYSLRLIPIGGYVAMEGENEESDDEGSFSNKPWWARSLVLIAGPFMNFLLAVFVIAGLITYAGTSIDNKIESLADASPAQAAGIQAGDIVTSVEGKPVTKVNEAAIFIQKAAENSDSVKLSVKRGESEKSYNLKFEENEDHLKFVGIQFEKNHNFFVGFVRSFRQSVEIEKQIITVLKDLFTGKGSAKDISGPVGLVTVVDQVSRTGIFNMLYLMALLSLNLGLVNILPFPALDGGRLLFVIIRIFTGKAISDELESKIHFAGIMILFMLMILITFKDIKSLITG